MIGVLSFLAVEPRSQPKEETKAENDYVIVNGWVLTRKDTLLR